jgi:hypothetical protein
MSFILHESFGAEPVGGLRILNDGSAARALDVVAPAGADFEPVDFGFGLSAFLNRNTSVPDASVYTFIGTFRVTEFPPSWSPILSGSWFSFGDQFEGLQVNEVGALRVVGYNVFDVPGDSIELGRTYHVSIRRNGDDFDIRLKPDGGSWSTVYSGSTDQTGAVAWGQINVNFAFMAWHGQVWCVRFWEDALDNTELDTEFASIVAVRTTNLWADWQMAAGALADDGSGNGNDFNNVLADEWDGSLPSQYATGPVLTDGITIGGWVYISSQGAGDEPLLTLNFETESVSIFRESSGDLYQKVLSLSADASTGTMAGGAWYQLAYVITPSEQKLYLAPMGGTLALISSTTHDLSAAGGLDSFYLAVNDELDATFYQTRIWDTALSYADLDIERDSPEPYKLAYLWADYRTENDGTEATRLADSSGFDRDLTGILTEDWTGSLPEMALLAIVSDAIVGTDYIGPEAGRGTNDTVSVSDSLTVDFYPGASAIERDASDSIVVSDEILRTATFGRTASDTDSVSDAIATSLAYARSVSDSVSVTDVLGLEVGTGANDSVSVTDSLSVSLQYGRIVSDTAVATDALSVALSYGRSQTDSVSATDSAATSLEYGRTISESVVVSDSLTTTMGGATGISDTVSVSDSLVVSVQYVRTSTDSVAVSDSAARALDASRATSDAVSVSDSVARELSAARTASDTASVSDSAARVHDASRSISDTISVSDSLVVSIQYARTATDSVAVSDSIVRAQNTSRSTSDSVVATDSLSRSAAFGRAATDSASTTDGASWTFEPTANDTVAVVDSLVRSTNTSRSVSDSVSVSDSIQTTVGSSADIEINDTVSVTDALQRAHTAVRSASDAVAATDSLVRAIGYQRSLSDSVSVSDSAQTSMDKSVVVSDAATTTDQARASLTIAVVVSDAVVVADAISTSRDIGASASDSVATTDQIRASVEYARTAADSVAVSDSIEYTTASAEVEVSDAVEVSDQIAVRVSRFLVIEDAVAVTDSVLAVRTLGAYASDAIAASDSIAATLESIAPDSVAVTDQLQRSVSFHRTINDSMAVEDAVAIGDGTLVGHGVLDGIVTGSADAYTVDSDGPVSASGGPEWLPPPVGFAVETGDQVELADVLRVGLVYHIVLSDSIDALDLAEAA